MKKSTTVANFSSDDNVFNLHIPCCLIFLDPVILIILIFHFFNLLHCILVGRDDFWMAETTEITR